MPKKSHEDWMRKALLLAKKAASIGEIPVGALVVYKNEIIGQGFNLREKNKDPLAHAEMIAIKEASEKLQKWRLLDCTLYVTLEPCAMCAGAIVNSRIKTLCFAAFDKKAGAVCSLMNIGSDSRLNHQVEIIKGLLEEDSKKLLQDFFRNLRNTKKPQLI